MVTLATCERVAHTETQSARKELGGGGGGEARLAQGQAGLKGPLVWMGLHCSVGYFLR